MKKVDLLAASAIVLLATTPSYARAQAAQQSAADQSDNQLEDIVVTEIGRAHV